MSIQIVFARIATRMNRWVWALSNMAVISLLAGMVMLDKGNGGMRTTGFCLAILGIWCGGLAFFSEAFAQKEQVLEGGKYRLASKIEMAGPTKGLAISIGVLLWFVGLGLLTVAFFRKVFG